MDKVNSEAVCCKCSGIVEQVKNVPMVVVFFDHTMPLIKSFQTG